MSAPQASTATNISCLVCASVLAQNSERPRAWPEKSAGPIRDAVTAFASAAIHEASGWPADVARVKP